LPIQTQQPCSTITFILIEPPETELLAQEILEMEHRAQT
jgi:hypothetical protein